jgi:hypothetical protein
MQQPPQYPQEPNWTPPQHTQYPPYQQTGPGIPPPPQYYPTGGLPPQYPPPPQQPSIWRRKFGCAPVWLITLLCGLLMCSVLSYASARNDKSTTDTTLTGAQIAATNSAQLIATNAADCAASTTCTSNATPVPTATPDKSIPTSTPAPTQPPAKWVTTHTYKGNGSKKTGVISVPDDWKIVWSCDPTSFDNIDFNMIITVYNSDGTYADSGVNSTCSKTNTHDETEEHQSGNVYLDITSEGSWTIQVQEFK